MRSKANSIPSNTNFLKSKDVSLVTFKSKNRNLNLLKTFQHMTKIVIIILYFAVRVDLCVILGDVFLETGSATSATTSHVTTSGEQDGGRDELICNLGVCFRKIMVFLSF